MAERLFVIDGMAFAFRSYYAIRNLRDSKGNPVNAVFGFARVLLKIIREQEPSHLVVVFDAPGKTFRDDLYPEYKGNRPDTPEELLYQFPLIDEVVEAFDIPILRVEGVEADDVMGTLARRAEAQNLETVLVSADKDILQLASGHTTVYDPNKGDDGVWYGPAEVKERYGVDPEHLIDVLGLMGDSVDNVPGVRGIGEKTARKLLEKYGTMEELYAHIDELKGKQKEKLIEDKDKAFLSRQLVTIDCDVDFDLDFDAFRRKELDPAKLSAVFGKLEFRSLLEEFLPEAEAQESVTYKLVLSAGELDAVVRQIKQAGRFAVDTETTSTYPMRADLVGISVSCAEREGYYIPVAHAPHAMTVDGQPVAGLDRAQILEKLAPLLDDDGIGKIAHNAKYDWIVLDRAGLPVRGWAMDTMVASYLTDSSRVRHNLTELSLQYLKRKMVPIADVIGKGAKAVTFDHVPIDTACAYAAEDADVTWRLAGVFESSLKERELESLFREVELPLIGVLTRMEMAGVAIDRGVFDELLREIEGRLNTLEREIHDLAGGPFQINSPKQLQKVLFETLKLPPKKKTKTGYSTDVEVLEALAQEHPLPERLLEYRGLEKLRGTYVEALPKLVHPETGRIHTSFNQAVAATGRLSSSDPNLQNIPVRTEMGRRIREGFVAGDPGLRLISADYSQIELRVLAHLAGDAALKDAFLRDEDIHRDTAARIFNVAAADVTPEMRRQAKAVNFGVVYGISAYGLARNLGVSNAEAASFIEHYFATYPGVKEWIDTTKAAAKEQGYVTTLLGRRRYVPELNSSDHGTRRAAERVAVNTPVQGTAADVIKLAMIRLDTALTGTEARLLVQVHDELLIEAPEAGAEAVAEQTRDIMANAVELTVPLKVDVGIGRTWAEIH